MGSSNIHVAFISLFHEHYFHVQTYRIGLQRMPNFLLGIFIMTYMPNGAFFHNDNAYFHFL